MTDIASLGIAVDSRQVKEGSSALDRLADSGGRAENSTKSLAAANRVLLGAVGLVVQAYAGLKMAQYIKDATLLHARYETLGVSMRVVGNNAGYTARQMEEAALGLQKTGISMVESRQQILRLVSAQIDLTNASKLARVAQDAAVIGNINSSEAFSRLIFGISSAQTEVLRGIGLNVSMERSYKEMAKSLGVTTEQLTQAQRTQSILNSVMKQGEGIAGTYEAAMSTAGKQMNSMARYTENLKLILGETFNEALVIVVEAQTKALKGLNAEAQELALKGNLREWGRDAIMVGANVIDAFRLVKNVFVQAAGGVTFLYEATKLALKGQFSEIKKLSEEQTRQNDDFVKNITLVSDTARERFALIDRERANASAGVDTPGKVNKPSEGSVQDDADALKRAATEYKNLVQSIREKIAVQSLELSQEKSLTDSQKVALDIMVKLRDGELKLSDAKKQRLVTELESLAAIEQAVANMNFAKQAGDDLMQSGQQQVMSLEQQVIAQREHNSTLWMTKEQILAVTGARNLELAANLRNAASYAGPLHNAYIVHANDLEKLAGLQKELVSEQQIAKNAEEWKRIGNTIEQTGKMAFVQFAAHGTNAMKAIGQSIKLSIIDTIYQLTVRKWVVQIIASVSGGLASGAASAAGGGGLGITNLLSGGSSLFSALGGGLTSGLSSAVTGLGSMFGSSALSAFGAGMTMSTAAATAGAAELGAVGLGSIGSAMSMGSMAAAIAGPLAVAAIADMGFRLLAGNKTIKGAEALSYVPVIGPLINALFGAGPKKLGPEELTGEFAADGFHGEFQADWKRKVGPFGGKKRGRRGLGIEPEQLDAVNTMMFGISDSIQEFVKLTGDSERSLDGWTFAVRQQVETEEQQAQLALDIANSLGAYLIPELVSLQQKGETLVETLGRVRAEFVLTDQIIDLTGQSFGRTGLASLTLRDNLVQMFGGLQGAGAALQPFFENFYTDAERIASTSRLMNAEMAKLGITVIPATRDQFRALVEAQDLSTESGQKMFTALVGFAPAFASITAGAEKAADDMEAEAERIKNSFKVLGTESFATLFEYNKYIQLARNAGITAAEPESVFNKGAAQEQYFLPSLAVGTNELPTDMIISAHRGERIIPAADNRELMRALSSRNKDLREVVEQLKKLREEGRAHALALAKNTSKTAKLLDQFSLDGMPPVRTA